MFKSCLNAIANFFTYNTVRTAKVESQTVGVSFRLAQLVIVIYVGWELAYTKGYQSFDTISSVTTTEVRGQGYVPLKKILKKLDNDFNAQNTYELIDSSDFLTSPNEFNSIFIMTNFVKTEQTLGYCGEETDKNNAICNIDLDCQHLGTNTNSWNGIPTGKCIDKDINSTTKVCEIRGWCPTENEHERFEDNSIRNVLNYKILIKNSIEFKKLNRKERNIETDFANYNYFSECIYNEVTDPNCPVFLVGDIVNRVEHDAVEKSQMLLKGSIILIEITWNCDYDIFWKKCLPNYAFKRFDHRFMDQPATSSGFNFRFSKVYQLNNSKSRTLYKAYGLRFIVSVTGIGGRFSVVPLALKIGSGIGLMSISVIIADCVMLNCTIHRKIFRQIKYLN